jgi:hypothetical protein
MLAMTMTPPANGSGSGGGGDDNRASNPCEPFTLQGCCE